ncbi:hypothetical protein QL285_086939 [Trifolium repens]|nr:hypothetical protein QL285_086939 [Trifolium repens]
MPEVVVELRFNQCRAYLSFSLKSTRCAKINLEAGNILLVFSRSHHSSGFLSSDLLSNDISFLPSIHSRTHVNGGDFEENLKKALLKYS